MNKTEEHISIKESLPLSEFICHFAFPKEVMFISLLKQRESIEKAKRAMGDTGRLPEVLPSGLIKEGICPKRGGTSTFFSGVRHQDDPIVFHCLDRHYEWRDPDIPEEQAQDQEDIVLEVPTQDR